MWLQINRARELLKGSCPTVLLEEGLGALVVSLDKAWVDLQSAAVGDVGLGVLTLFEIEVALLQVLQFAHLGIARAASHEGGQEQEKPVRQYQTRLAPDRRWFTGVHRQHLFRASTGAILSPEKGRME